MITDAAITVGVGQVDAKGKKLIEVTRQALAEGIKAARQGNTVGDIGFAIQSVVLPAGFNMPIEFGGHGVGYAVHEDPSIPNFGKPGEGEVLRPGMVIAIEPLVTEGSGKIQLSSDGFTIETADGARAAHFEHTVLITEGAPEILTKE
jgi:methionyl aminopeptidase